jgi:hypothetical protein
MDTITRPEPVTEVSTIAPRGALGMVVTALIAGAFVTGWHFGRRWAHLIGW